MTKNNNYQATRTHALAVASDIDPDSLIQLSRSNSHRLDTRNGGGGRSRTDDPLLAKQVLYQLSYAPIWWAKEDLNLRPHAYQACALTN